MRRAKVVLKVTRRCEATGLTAGERSDTETVTLRSERGGWKRAIASWYLAGRLLNLGHPFAKSAIFYERMTQVASTMKKPSQGLYFALLGSSSVAHFDL